jgi:hypothetical protein
MIPVAGLLDVIPSSSVTIRTWGGGSVDTYGRYVASASVDTVETIPVHPATSRRMRDLLPDAVRDRETIALYTRPSSPLVRVTGRPTPEVLYSGRWYTVTHDGDYDTLGGIRLVLASLKDATT